jgi:hypothetical protein
MYTDRDTLFNMPDETHSTAETFGCGRQNVLLVVKRDQYSDTESEFLKNIIKAVKLDIAEDCEVLLLGQNRSVIHMHFQKDHEVVIVFGLKPDEVGMQISHQLYSILPMGKRLYLFVDELPSIQKDQTLKTKLWNTLKIIFAKNF